VGVDAGRAVSARVVLALIDVFVAVPAGETQRAGAVVVAEVNRRGAGGPVGALVVLTGVHFAFACFSGIGSFTHALEVVGQVDAGAPVLAGRRLAVVDVGLAVLAGESFRALAGVGVVVSKTLAAVLAGIGLAKVDLVLTPFALVSGLALADELVEPVLAGPAVQAGARGALVDVGGAGGAVVAPRAVAFEPCHVVYAGAAIDAWRAGGDVAKPCFIIRHRL